MHRLRLFQYHLIDVFFFSDSDNKNHCCCFQLGVMEFKIRILSNIFYLPCDVGHGGLWIS